ncbi:MAG: glycosyl hydrolase 53 family protein [Bacteroidota bacterium]
MLQKFHHTFWILFLALSACSDDLEENPSPTERNFKMGFTTWSYGPNLEDVNNTYSFIADNSDIYAEHIDNKIPWEAWINDEPLPIAFANEITGRANRKIAQKQLLLSVSLLNSNRDDLAEDLDGSIPTYTNLDDEVIENAYVKHIDYLLGQFQPNYLVITIEVNELRLRSADKWPAYTRLMQNVISRIRTMHPGIPISESISLHNLYEPMVAEPEAYISEIVTRMNQMDFVAISFYPFFKSLATQEDFQQALDFLHDRINKPIAFVETGHIAENLVVPNLNVNITGNEIEQNTYLQTLLTNAENQNYEFVIWWAYRDYDALWATFPNELRDLGQLWRDTGLLDEDGMERPSLATWSDHFSK